MLTKSSHKIQVTTSSPHISPMDAKITPDLCFQRVPATESIAVTMVEEAGTRWEHKDK